MTVGRKIEGQRQWRVEYKETACVDRDVDIRRELRGKGVRILLGAKEQVTPPSSW